MTESEKNIITKMRESGTTYANIASHLSLSQNTIKSYCQRKGIQPLPKQADSAELRFCAQCGQPLARHANRKPKRFCSDKCRSRWWNRHRQELSKKTAVIITCAYCGNRFESYPQEHRKYCCHTCYIKARFGGDQHVTKAG